jgi:glucosyl-dolichyl phosphate glucuronosyltransferase
VSASTVRDQTIPSAGSKPSVSVIVCAYTLDRWDLLLASVQSVLEQTLRPEEVFVCIDHNEELYHRCQDHWSAEPRVSVVQNKYAGRLGSARTTAAEMAIGEFIAFLDDDASADKGWLSRLIDPYCDPNVLATGGSPLPVFSRPRPRWFPLECDWVFGCVYRGLPNTREPVLHLIGANMSVRREALKRIGYFHSDNHDDMDMCHRVLHAYPGGTVLFIPEAIVRHVVHQERLTFKYFWRRCFTVNRGKAGAFKSMGQAGNLKAERRFVWHALSQATHEETRALARGDVYAPLRVGTLILGIFLAGAGYGVGTVETRLRGRSQVQRS